MVVGTGLSFPLEISQKTGQWKIHGDRVGTPEVKLKQRVELIINTMIGTRFFNRRYGSNNEDLVFEPINNSTVVLSRERLIEAVNEQEPDINATDIQFINPEGKPSTLVIKVLYFSNEIDDSEPLKIDVSV